MTTQTKPAVAAAVDAIAHQHCAGLGADRLATVLPKSKAQLNREKYAAQAAEQATRAKAERKARRERRESRPAWGSQEWAETRGDDLGASPDC